MKAKSTLHKQSKPPLQNIAKSTLFFQPKLTINQPNDVHEQEADAMADKVMRMEQPGVQLKPLSISTVQRKCTHCEDEEKAQRKEMNEQETHADANLENYVGKLGSSGTPLSNKARNFYEPRFGYDFSQVKIHTDTVAAKSAQSINALAYTSGNNIVFNQGQFSPDTDSGKRLLGHELTHVVQQSSELSKQNIRRAGFGDLKVAEARHAEEERITKGCPVINEGTLSEVSWGETLGLYPSIENKYDPTKWDGAKVCELLRLRGAIHRVGQRGEKVHRAKPGNSKIETMLKPYHLVDNFLSTDAEIVDEGVRWFYLSSKSSLQTHPTMSSLGSVKTYGPFYNIGGGDVPKGDTYVHFYKKK
jgi:hypothetical protein